MKVLFPVFIAAASAATCNNYCSDDLDLSGCSPSPLWTPGTFDLEMPPELANGEAGKRYSKCAYTWKADADGVVGDSPVMCPPNDTPAECESCGFSWSGPDTFAPFSSIESCCPGYLDQDGSHFYYNYKWNERMAQRSSYTKTTGTCYFWCDEPGYSCSGRNWWGKGSCSIDSDARFLNERCDNSDQCNTATVKQANMVCSRISNQCLLKEDASREHIAGGGGRTECTCSVLDHQTVSGFFTGLLWCNNYKECGGNTCARTTQDMKMYCDADGAHSAECSNCRKADDACGKTSGS